MSFLAGVMLPGELWQRAGGRRDRIGIWRGWQVDDENTDSQRRKNRDTQKATERQTMWKGNKKVNKKLLWFCIIFAGESRGSVGVSVLQPHSQHHHCEHHQSPQPQSHGHRRHFWYNKCSFILHVLLFLPSTSELLQKQNKRMWFSSLKQWCKSHGCTQTKTRFNRKRFCKLTYPPSPT